MSRTVVVLGRNYTARLGMIRAAGTAGCSVIAVHVENWANKEEYDRESRFISGYYKVQEDDPQQITACLKKIAAEHGAGDAADKLVILPTDDNAASFIDMHQEDLADGYLFPHVIADAAAAGADAEGAKALTAGAAVRCMDKGWQKDLAEAAGLKCAKGWTLTFDGQNYAVPEDITFPCFIKPQTSIKGVKKIMKKCTDRAELEAHLESVAALQRGTGDRWELLAEQFIEIGREFDLPGFANGEHVLFPVFLEKGILHRGVTGTATLHDAGEFPEAHEALLKMAAGLHFTGLIDVELFESGGEIYFNELNMRFGASGYGLTGYGINLPGLLIRTLAAQAKGQADYAPEQDETFMRECGELLPVTEKTFASEKVILQEYRAGVISWNKYKEIIDGADFNFIRNADDPAPFEKYERESASLHRSLAVKRVIKKLIGKK